MLQFFFKFKHWIGQLFDADKNNEHQNKKSQNNNNMAMFNYGVGGNEVKVGNEEWTIVEEKDILAIVN